MLNLLLPVVEPVLDNNLMSELADDPGQTRSSLSLDPTSFVGVVDANGGPPNGNPRNFPQADQSYRDSLNMKFSRIVCRNSCQKQIQQIA